MKVLNSKNIPLDKILGSRNAKIMYVIIVISA